MSFSAGFEEHAAEIENDLTEPGETAQVKCFEVFIADDDGSRIEIENPVAWNESELAEHMIRAETLAKAMNEEISLKIILGACSAQTKPAYENPQEDPASDTDISF